MATEFNFSELITNVSKALQISKVECTAVIEQSFVEMARQLGTRQDASAKETKHGVRPGGRIELAPFGVLKLKYVAERQGKTSGRIGPVTEWVKPAHYTVKFKAMPDFLQMINSYLETETPLKAE
jgi:nucleoid DNA-binding protein